MSAEGLPVRAQKLRLARVQLGLTRSELAAGCGCSPTSIGRYEEGACPIKDSRCRSICDAFGIDEVWFMDDAALAGEKAVFVEAIRADGCGGGPAERLRAVYEQSGLSQRAFCRKMGSSLSNLQNVLSGKQSLSRRYAERVEQAFGVGAEWLLLGRDEAKEDACGEEMIRFLKRHPEVRRKIRAMMDAEARKKQ